MRGIVSPKLTPLLEQVAIATTEAQAQGIGFSPELTRSNLNKLSELMGQGPQVSLVKDLSLAASDHQLDVRLYHPDPSKALPVLLHFHGGGHMCGSIELYDSISRELAQRTQSIVLTIDYRLAPEHPYPCGIDDCQLLLEQYQQLLSGLNFSQQLFIAGDSAGGAICTTLVMNNIDNDKISITKQILVYPSVDYTLSSPSVEHNGQGFLLDKAKVAWYFQSYFQNKGQNKAQDSAVIRAASPLLGRFDARMPTTLVITAGCDPLRDEGIAYAKKLAEVGVNVQHHQFDSMIHAYMLLRSMVEEEVEQTYQIISDFIAR